MARLKVEVRGDRSLARMMTVPYDVFSADGERLGRGTASPVTADSSVTLPPGLARAYVVGTLPGGGQIQAPVRFGPAGEANALLEFEESPHEWLQWLTPFESLKHIPSAHRPATPPSSRAVGRVWMVLWRFAGGRWETLPAPHTFEHADAGARQVALDLSIEPHLLQVGGDHVAWRLVSLPPGGRVMVAITQAAGEEGDTVRVNVGRTRPMDDLIMAYLTRGQQAEADRLADAWKTADMLLYSKFDDPVSAAAGAYTLLKLGRVRERRDWVQNLVAHFPHADGAIVAACMALNDSASGPAKVRHYIEIAVDRGLPVFALGMSLLVEAMAAVHQGPDESSEFRAAYQAARSYLQARAVVGPYFAFYGTTPMEPSYERMYGALGAPAPGPGQQPQPMLITQPSPLHATRRFGKIEVTLPGSGAASTGAPSLDTTPQALANSMEVFTDKD